MKAAVASKFRGATHKKRIEILLENILLALDGLDPTQPTEALCRSAVEANVRWTVGQILATPEAQAQLESTHLRLVGAVYDIESGRVRFLGS